MEICNFLRFKRRDGTYTDWMAQNFFIGEVVLHNENSYPYQPVAVATAGGTQGGDRSEAVIGAPMSVLSLNVFTEAANSDWLLEVRNVKVNRATLTLGALLSTEIWAAQQVQHEAGEPVVKLQLASPLDAVRATGGRVLSQLLVGALPSSGNLVVQ
jgi:hypothetical protein